MSKPPDPIELLTRLCGIAEQMTATRMMQLPRVTIEALRDEVAGARRRVAPEWDIVNYQSVCLVECLAALAYARSDEDRAAEDRARMYADDFRKFIRLDLDIAKLAAERMQ